MAPSDEAEEDFLMTRLGAVSSNVEELMQYVGMDGRLIQLRSHIRQCLRRLQPFLNTCTLPVDGIADPTELRQTGRRGRPSLPVNVDQVEMLRGIGYTWDEVANAIGVSRTTLWRRLTEQNITLSRYLDISDFDLDQVISRIQHDFPNAGLVMIQGHLLSEGVHVPRQRVRESVARCDPIRRRLRWHQVLTRRSYSVPRPNSLWHIDGHHSLIRWRLVIHGGIDGYSRMVVYLHCSTNNRAESVFNLFWKASRLYGVPSRVRSDKGGENIDVCRFMVSQRGIGRGSFIAGASTHNQRIERLWRDVYRCVAATYHEVFFYMEDEGMLDPDVDIVLHCVFLPIINRSLERFTQAWNQHPMRTERMWSPKKIWMNGVLRCAGEGHQILDVLDPTPGDLSSFGIDPSGPFPQARQQVDVPDTICPLSDNAKQRFLDCIQLLESDPNPLTDYGVRRFLQAKSFFRRIFQDSTSSDSDI